jgi:hypothetical protein
MNAFDVGTSLLIFIYLLIDFNYFGNLFCISYLFLWQLLAQIVVCVTLQNLEKQWKTTLEKYYCIVAHVLDPFRHADKKIR